MKDVIIASKRDITFMNVFIEKETISIKGNISENPKTNNVIKKIQKPLLKS